ncbi:MAG: hypothetical protein ABIH72_01410 [archaeon]
MESYIADPRSDEEQFREIISPHPKYVVNSVEDFQSYRSAVNLITEKVDNGNPEERSKIREQIWSVGGNWYFICSEVIDLERLRQEGLDIELFEDSIFN